MPLEKLVTAVHKRKKSTRVRKGDHDKEKDVSESTHT
jgi:hypothetical protein